MNPLVILAAIFLSVLLSFEAIVIRYLVKNNKVPYEQIVILVEVFKCLVSYLMVWCTKSEYTSIPSMMSEANGCETREVNETREVSVSDPSETREANEDVANGSEANGGVARRESWNWWTVYHYIAPAVVYTIGNNVTYFALQEVTPVMYTLLVNLKIPFTAILGYIFLKYIVTYRFVVSYCVLFFSVVIASLKITNDVTFGVSVLGLLEMLLYTTCSASGGLLMEYITQYRFERENLYIQNVKFSLISIFCNLIVILIRFQVPFVNLQWVHLLVISVSGMYGLVTSVVIKYSGSILKTYAVSTSMFGTAFVSFILFRETFDWNFYVGSIGCVLAVVLYSREYIRVKVGRGRVDEDVET